MANNQIIHCEDKVFNYVTKMRGEKVWKSWFLPRTLAFLSFCLEKLFSSLNFSHQLSLFTVSPASQLVWWHAFQEMLTYLNRKINWYLLIEKLNVQATLNAKVIFSSLLRAKIDIRLPTAVHLNFKCITRDIKLSNFIQVQKRRGESIFHQMNLMPSIKINDGMVLTSTFFFKKIK